MAVDTQKQVLMYMQLLQSGVPAKDAFNQAFPNGVPTALDRNKEIAKAQQKGAYGQIGGLLIGALASKGVFQAVTGKNVFGSPSLTEALGLTPEAGTTTVANALSPASTTTGSLGSGSGIVDSIPDFNPGDPGFGAGAAGANVTSSGAPIEGLFGGGTEGTGGMSTFAGAATPYLGIGGTALGAYEAYQGIKEHNPLAAGLGGLGAVGGLNMMGYALGPYGIAATIAAPALMAALSGAFNHKKTSKYEEEQSQKLQGLGFDTSMRDADIAARKAGGGILAVPQGREGLIDERGHLTAAGWKDPSSLWGTSGMLETFGPDYMNKMSEQDRYALTKEAINQNLFKSSKGDIYITDPEKLRAAASSALQNPDYIKEYQDFKNGTMAMAAMQPQGPIQQPMAPQMSPALQAATIKQTGAFGNQLFNALRTKTLSPGIGLDGKPIQY